MKISTSKKFENEVKKCAYRLGGFATTTISVLGYVIIPSIILSVWAIRAEQGDEESILFLSLLVGSILIGNVADRICDLFLDGYAKEYFKYR